jgi:FixJ family two-component response regulator
MKTGAVELVTKPYDIAVLLDAIDVAIARTRDANVVGDLRPVGHLSHRIIPDLRSDSTTPIR